jgi:hypothetical protein
MCSADPPGRLEVNARQRDAPSGAFVVWSRGKLEPPMNHADLNVEDAVNETCPWSGKPIATDSLTRYRGAVVGFCNPGCRDKFEKAVEHFEQALLERPARLLAPET